MGQYVPAQGPGHGHGEILNIGKANILIPRYSVGEIHPLCAVGYRFSLKQMAFIYSKLYFQNALQFGGCELHFRLALPLVRNLSPLAGPQRLPCEQWGGFCKQVKGSHNHTPYPPAEGT